MRLIERGVCGGGGGSAVESGEYQAGLLGIITYSS